MSVIKVQLLICYVFYNWLEFPHNWLHLPCSASGPAITCWSGHGFFIGLLEKLQTVLKLISFSLLGKFSNWNFIYTCMYKLCIFIYMYAYLSRFVYILYTWIYIYILYICFDRISLPLLWTEIEIFHIFQTWWEHNKWINWVFSVCFQFVCFVFLVFNFGCLANFTCTSPCPIVMLLWLQT